MEIPYSAVDNMDKEYTLNSSDYENVYKQVIERVGSLERSKRKTRVLTLTGGTQYEYKDIELAEAIENIFRHVLSVVTNYSPLEDLPMEITDNEIPTQWFPNINDNPNIVTVMMNRNKIRIKAQNVMFLVRETNSGKWTPELYFTGHHGSLTNIFSEKFSITIGDPYNKVEYFQTWEDNMKIKNDPIVFYGYTRAPYIEIEYTLDHEKFGYSHYSDEAFQLFSGIAVDLTLTHKLPVKFRISYGDGGWTQTKWYPKDIMEYANLYKGRSDKILYTNLDCNEPIVSENASVGKPLPFETQIFLSPGNGKCLVFVNGKQSQEYNEVVYEYISGKFGLKREQLEKDLRIYMSMWYEHDCDNNNNNNNNCNINDIILGHLERHFKVDGQLEILKPATPDKPKSKRSFVSRLWKKIW
jgi:hypothetical protein